MSDPDDHPWLCVYLDDGMTISSDIHGSSGDRDEVIRDMQARLAHPEEGVITISTEGDTTIIPATKVKAVVITRSGPKQTMRPGGVRENG